jgi:GGDEF domain-containing protein
MPVTGVDTLRAVDPDGDVVGKRVLVEVSHAIEQFALAAPPGEPLVVIAMFQKLSYFEREASVYRDIAARGSVTLVGLVEDFPPQLPPGVLHSLLAPADPLAREWSVTVLGAHGGATLVAVDQESVDPTARTLEEGRRFRGRWSFRRDDAYREVLRLRSELRLPPGTVEEIDFVLRRVLSQPGPGRQNWWEVPMAFLTDRMGLAVREQTAASGALDAALNSAQDRDPHTGIYTEGFLDRWTAGLGVGTLPIGLALLRVSGLADLRTRYGVRSELEVLQGIAGCVGDLLSDGDRMVRLDDDDLLVVLPAWEAADVRMFCDEVCARVVRLDEVYPFIALPTVAAATVTRSRPFPVDQLMRQMELESGVPGTVGAVAG